MNEPKEEGYYWVRCNCLQRNNGTINSDKTLIKASREEIVHVVLDYPPYCKNHDKATKILMVIGSFWKRKLTECPEYWQWGKKLIHDIPEFSIEVLENMKDCFFKEGYDGNKDGYDKEDCPYEEGTDGQYGWIKGWNYGEGKR